LVSKWYYAKNNRFGYISFAAHRREGDAIPPYPPQPFAVNAESIATLSQARNFLYLINPSGFPSKGAFLDALRNTDYDLLIIDLFYQGEALTPEEVRSLQVKKNGARRLVVSYLSIGEAEERGSLFLPPCDLYIDYCWGAFCWLRQASASKPLSA
jgi:cysteinyl-tRNA synthetase